MTDYTLAGDHCGFALTGIGTPARLFGGSGSFSLSGQTAELVRNLTITGTTLVLALTRLRIMDKIGRPDGTPTPEFHRKMQRRDEAIEAAFAGLASQVSALQATYAATAQANAAASAANNAVAQVAALTETVQSTVTAIEDGTYNFDKITVGGTEFGNVGESFQPLP